MPNLLVTEEQRLENARKSREWRARKRAENPEAFKVWQRENDRKYAAHHPELIRRKGRKKQKRAAKELRPYYVRDKLAVCLRQAGMHTNPSDYPPELVDAWADSIKAGRLFRKKSKKLSNQTTKGLQ
jgi:hypothetical protein